MDKQDLAYIEMRLSILEKLLFNNKKDVEDYIAIIEKVKESTQFGDAVRLKQLVEEHLQSLGRLLSEMEE
ncbi:hypothetical protein [Amniculibacterium sp. G2-70]|uniref:hypothetical protein n=1 Tax=Amniculibacterium sp. G2-70 TaxID=2767188 RepID=UPI00165455EF|nr:hypothetical protein [Amniculibacterium sp. G2-70]